MTEPLRPMNFQNICCSSVMDPMIIKVLRQPTYFFTYQSLNSISLTGSYVSDDFYGFLDNQEGDWDDGVQDLLDIGIGKVPGKNIIGSNNSG